MKKLVLLTMLLCGCLFAETVTIIQTENSVEKVLFKKKYSTKFPKDDIELCSYRDISGDTYKCKSSFEVSGGLDKDYVIKIKLSYISNISKKNNIFSVNHVEDFLSLNKNQKQQTEDKNIFINIEE